MATNADLLLLYTDAEAKILRGQTVRFGERQLSMPDLEFVQRERLRLQGLVALELTGGRRRFGQADFSGGHGGIEGAEWNRC